MKKSRKIKYAFISLGILATSLAILSFNTIKNRNFEVAKNLEIYSSIIKELELFYVDTLNIEEVVKTSIDKMFESLDPYNEYYPEDNKDKLEQLLKGTFGGIGSAIGFDNKLNCTIIREPFANTPSSKAGLKAGDIIVKIDDTDTRGMNSTKVTKLLRGEVGTKFKLQIERPNKAGKNDLMTFDITRETIQAPLIAYEGIIDDKGTGYIVLTSFSGSPSKEFKEAYLRLKEKGLKTLIIDLRNNGGGLLHEATNLVNFFLPKGKIVVSTKGKIKQAESIYKTVNTPIDLEVPIAVLINGATASASEIVAGALQDYDRAVIIGNKSFGKGLVQSPRRLPYGANMKITTSKYYIPSGRCVQAIDYKNRDEDGNIIKASDSIAKVFYTEAGRKVLDKGGITPDVKIEQEKMSNLLINLIINNITFNYATRYCLNNEKIAQPDKFHLTDKDYNDFKDYVKSIDFKYDLQSEKILNNLKEIANLEGYMDSAKEEFKALSDKLKHNLDKDLEFFKEEIKEYIEKDIVARYYYQRGVIEASINKDKDIKKALEILNDKEKYRSILKGNR